MKYRMVWFCAWSNIYLWKQNTCKVFVAEGPDVKTSQQRDDIFLHWLFMGQQYIAIKQKAYIFKSDVPTLFSHWSSLEGSKSQTHNDAWLWQGWSGGSPITAVIKQIACQKSSLKTNPIAYNGQIIILMVLKKMSLTLWLWSWVLGQPIVTDP